jgi:hypothetical protein
MRSIALVICFLAVPAISICQSRPSSGFRMPTCLTHSEGMQWGVALTSKRQIRFQIDDAAGDKCTIYFDLEFVVSLLDASGKQIAIRRFSVPDEFAGPSATSYDFPIGETAVARVKGLALHCKKRLVGGLPGPGESGGLDDPDQPLRNGLRERLEKEKDSYTEWLRADFDYVELVSKSGTTCGKEGTPATIDCATARLDAEKLKDKRKEQFGEAVEPPKH